MKKIVALSLVVVVALVGCATMQGVVDKVSSGIGSLSAGSGADASGNPSFVREKTDYTIGDSVDRIGNLYISYQSRLPSVMTFVNADGSVTVCSSNNANKITHIYEYSADLEQKKTLQFKNEFDLLGAFTKDSDGNYYMFYAKFVEENQRAVENMAVVKYDKGGEKLKTYKLKAYADGSFFGIKEPFEGGTCRLELSDSMLAVYFAREMFKSNDGLNHQASYGFVIDKNTFERLDKESKTGYNANSVGDMTMPYVSHSFNQFILPIDGGFIFADHGDASPRSFAFAQFKNGETSIRVQAFKFPGQNGQNATYAEMGGLSKTSKGYIFAGAYGKDINDSRNVFILTIDDNFSKCGNPIYITSYTKENGHAGHPKIVEMDAGRYLILWEKFKFSTQEANLVGQDPTGYQSTYMAVIDENGKMLSEIKELKGVRLNMNDVLRYNSQNGKVYWAINNTNKSITLYALEVEK